MGQHDATGDAPSRAEGVQFGTGKQSAPGVLALGVHELTVGEHLLVWRRREGLIQSEAAVRLGMYRNQYAETERDELDYKQPLPHLGELFSYEMCFIMRRRCGWTIPACAELVGVSRYWYNLMELGKASPERLVEYWSNHAG